MEGGVTSGIIYASAVAELAKHYRFRSIGGSSIGAFAAAVTAAAEYRRRGGSTEGFEFLADLPDLLAEEDAAGNTKLRSMFKPQKQTRRLFEIFLATLGYDTAARRFLCGLVAALRQYRGLVFVATLVTAALVLGPLVLTALGLAAPDIPSPALHWVAMGSWIVALLMAFTLSTMLALLGGIAWDVWFGLVPNGFGLCRGWSEEEAARVQEQRADPKDRPSHPKGKRSGAKDTDLAGFLHFAIQTAAGRKVDDPPLTFKDLWEAPEPPTDVLGYTGREPERRSINLELYATNLAHSRPYRFPLDAADDMGRLFFRMEDMYLYFPEPIWRFLAAYARPYRQQSPFDPPASDETQAYFEVPQEHLPIAAAARLALSFPLLISAIPLHAIDYEKKYTKRGLAECWMSDGGLCSNFPIHLFDSFMPKWPTFGISLQTRSEDWHGKPVWLPDRHYEGGGDSWHRIEGWPLKRLTRFLLGLWLATWRWNDMTMMRMPGVRDRVVRVLLKKNEGGVNIKMTGKEIRALTRTYGKPAGQEFVKKFVEGSDGWPEHRWVRFNRLLISLRQQIEGFRFATDLKRNMQPMDEQIDSSLLREPLRGLKKPRSRPRPSERPLREEQIGELKRLLAALSSLEEMFKQAGDHEPFIAMPRPSLRVRHPT
jgi:predicted acylesterase/phospholipase RssA